MQSVKNLVPFPLLKEMPENFKVYVLKLKNALSFWRD